MKLAYHTNAWGGVVGAASGVTSIKDLFYQTPGSTEEALRDIAAVGYQGFELFDGNLLEYENRQEEYKALTKKLGLTLVAVYSGANFIYADVLGDELWRLDKAAALAARFGAEHFVVGGGAKRSGGTREEDYKACGVGLEQAVAIARKYGLVASYHPHLGTISETPEGLEKIFQHTGINFCPDTAHIVAGGGDAAALIKGYRERVKYVHLKDWVRQPFGFVPLGKGELDFTAILSVLRDMSYQGWITVELDGYTGPRKEAAKISRAFLQKA